MWGFLGVLAFSFSLPFTRIAVEELDATFVGLGRALVAAVLAAIFLLATRAPLPARKDIPRFALVGLGVVIGFPLFSSLALKSLESAHASIVVGLLPAATAVFAVLRAGEHPSLGFWLAAGFGLVAVLAFVVSRGVGEIGAADLELLGASIICSLGYAEGAVLSRTLGGPQTICWALLLSAPVTFAITAVVLPGGDVGTDAWLGFAYVSVFSMFLGFFAWYAGLALGGVAKAGQVQLLQTPFTLVLAALVLGEEITTAAVLCTVAVVASVAGTQRARVHIAGRRPRDQVEVPSG
jgi:drug/metabolite transporter (DMT)-like permease